MFVVKVQALMKGAVRSILHELNNRSINNNQGFVAICQLSHIHTDLNAQDNNDKMRQTKKSIQFNKMRINIKTIGDKKHIVIIVKIHWSACHSWGCNLIE